MEPYHNAPVHGLLLSGRCVLLLLLLELGAALVLSADSVHSEQMLVRALIVLVLAIFLMPQQTTARPPAPARLMTWALLCGAAVLPGLLLSKPGLPGLSNELALLAGGIALLVFFFGSLAGALSRLLRDRRKASHSTLAVLALSLTLPFWTTPTVLINGSSKWLLDTIIALCPASYIATLIDLDYLRGDWLYQHTPYGSLRFDYPDPLYATAFIMLFSALLIAFSHFRLSGYRSKRSLDVATQPMEINL